MMRSLGYHRLVSMENFRQPNFELVADCLDWLLHRFEPGASIPDDITTEALRVEFIKAVCARIIDRTGVKLNPKKLYGADGYAAKELLRLATVLYDAQRSVTFDVKGDADDGGDFGLTSKLSDLKSTRSLCSSIIETGAGLFDLLEKEKDVKADREKALRFLDNMSRNLDSNSETEVVEKSVMALLTTHSQSLEQLKTMSEELVRDEKTLEQKIKKKRQELDRCQKRLGSLANVRPAFMDEYEQLEQELERYYEQYVGRFRNLDYLEHEIDVLNKDEKERMEENDRNLKRMQKRLRDEEWRLLRGEEEEKDGEKRKAPKGGRKGWAPPKGADAAAAAGEDDVSSAASDSDESPPISIAGGSSHLSDEDGQMLARGGGEDLEGGSNSDDDILNESDDEGASDDDAGFRGGGGGGGRKKTSSDDFAF